MFLFVLWSFRPRRPYKLWWRYICWRIETFTGIPSSEVTWKTFVTLGFQKKMRTSFINYLKWCHRMNKKVKKEKHHATL